MQEMAVVDSESFQREHEPLSTNLVLLVIILVLFHIGAIVSSLLLYGACYVCIAVDVATLNFVDVQYIVCAQQRPIPRICCI